MSNSDGHDIWVAFDENARISDKTHASQSSVDATAFVDFARRQKLTDLFFHVHGFNNSVQDAFSMGDEYFNLVRAQLSQRRGHSNGAGFCTVTWPSESNDPLAKQLDFSTVASRAEVVGSQGLAALANTIKEKLPALRVHLSGHSLGAKAAAWALAGLNEKTSIESLFLIQGALPGIVFASNVPQTGLWSLYKRITSGDLRGELVHVAHKSLRIGATRSPTDSDLAALYLLSNIPYVQLLTPSTSSQYETAPMGIQGIFQGRLERMGPYVAAVEAGKAYPSTNDRFITFDFNNIISNHNDFKKPAVAWAHLNLAGF